MLNTNSSTESILVPIANLETVSQLVSTAIDLAEDQKLDLELLAVVSVPEQLPLSAGKQFSDEKQDMLNDVCLFLGRSSSSRLERRMSKGVQAHTEFLHTNSTHCSLGSVRDAVLNVLYRGNAYLLTTIPDAADEDVYDRYKGYLSGYRRSIDNLLKLNRDPQDLEAVAFTFNDDGPVEYQLRALSVYGDDSVIQLPSADDPFTRDVLVAVAHYLLVYAILDQRWTQDRQLRQEIERGPEL